MVKDESYGHLGVPTRPGNVVTGPKMSNSYSAQSANEICAPYVYIPHCYGGQDATLPLHRIGVSLAQSGRTQSKIYLTRSDF